MCVCLLGDTGPQQERCGVQNSERLAALVSCIIRITPAERYKRAVVGLDNAIIGLIVALERSINTDHSHYSVLRIAIKLLH